MEEYSKEWKRITAQEQQEIRKLVSILPIRDIALMYNIDRKSVYYYLPWDWKKNRVSIRNISKRLKDVYMQRKENKLLDDINRKIFGFKADHDILDTKFGYLKYIKQDIQRDTKKDCTHTLPNKDTAIVSRCSLCGKTHSIRSPKII